MTHLRVCCAVHVSRPFSEIVLFTKWTLTSYPRRKYEVFFVFCTLPRYPIYTLLTEKRKSIDFTSIYFRHSTEIELNDFNVKSFNKQSILVLSRRNRISMTSSNSNSYFFSSWISVILRVCIENQIWLYKRQIKKKKKTMKNCTQNFSIFRDVEIYSLTIF